MAKKGNKKLGKGAGEKVGKGAGEKVAKPAESEDDRKLMNVTVTMPREVAHWSRVRAAEKNQSLARFLGDVLDEKMQLESTYETAMMRYLARPARELRRDGGEIPRREELR
jgi:hypothetical protein